MTPPPAWREDILRRPLKHLSYDEIRGLDRVTIMAILKNHHLDIEGDDDDLLLRLFALWNQVISDAMEARTPKNQVQNLHVSGGTFGIYKFRGEALICHVLLPLALNHHH